MIPIFFELKRNKDERGWLMELFRQDQLCQEDWPRMAYVSETEPGVVRGPHEHRDQSDLFVFVGPGNFDLHLWYGNQYKIEVVGESNPQAVLVPPGVVHGYKCISDYPGWVFNFPNKMYGGAGKNYPVDEIRHENDPNSFKIS